MGSADPLAPPGREAEPTAPEAAADDGLIVLSMTFDVLRVDLAHRDIRHSLKLWNHLDEAKGDPGLTALLARNGLRIGVGDASAWPAMRTIFEQNDARSTRAAHTLRDGLGLVVPLGGASEGDTYFLHQRNGQLEGGTFAAGSKVLLFDYAADETDPRRVAVTITPEFREHGGDTRVVQQGGELVTVADERGMTLHELATTVTLEPGGFVVIGSSAQADSGYLLGSWWLNSAFNREAYETVLCLSVQPTRTN